jgi:hypothetical protein
MQYQRHYIPIEIHIAMSAVFDDCNIPADDFAIKPTRTEKQLVDIMAWQKPKLNFMVHTAITD